MSASINLDPKIPSGPLADKWDRHEMDAGLVAPANRRKFHVIVVGTGLAGGGAAATLGEAVLGRNGVPVFLDHEIDADIGRALLTGLGQEDDIPVEFDDVQPAQAGEQRFRHGAEAGTDLYH